MQLVNKICTHETCKGIHQLNCFLEENVLEWVRTKHPREFFELESQFDNQEFEDFRHAVRMDFFEHQSKKLNMDQHSETISRGTRTWGHQEKTPQCVFKQPKYRVCIDGKYVRNAEEKNCQVRNICFPIPSDSYQEY